MSREIILTPLVVLMVLAGNAFAGTYGGGTGEPNNPYLIYDANQMNDIGVDANDWDKCFKLMANIDLGGFTGESFNIIGDNSSEPFSGVFDGNDHIISNFTYTSTYRTYVGLFGFVDGENAEIRNLRLIGANVDARPGYYIGSLVGRLQSGTITNCYARGGSVTGEYPVGGLVGLNHGTIANCYATANVAGEKRVGGFVGESDGTITNCYATGYVEGEHRLGGLVGENDGTITNCYATGNVEGRHRLGGLVGAHYQGTITNCYAAGKVTGINDTGGLVAYSSGHIINSYWNLETSNQQNSAGGEGKTPAQMMMASTFLN